jgi:nucleoid DNA-binding protein
MSKKFIAQVVQDSAELSGVAANRVASDLITAIVKEMKKEGGFTLQGFGTFRVAKTKARRTFDALKRTVLLALIIMASPVAGFSPLRASV